MPAPNSDESKDITMRVDAFGNPSWPGEPAVPLPCVYVFVESVRAFAVHCRTGVRDWSVPPIDGGCPFCRGPIKSVSFLSSLETK
jgi:hypothetical protein